MDYDLVYLSAPDVILIWNSVNYTSLAAFKSATGRETHGTQADPKRTSPNGGDFPPHRWLPCDRFCQLGRKRPAECRHGRKPPPRRPCHPEHGRGAPAIRRSGAYEFAGSELDHIVISPSSATIAAGGSQAYTAQGFDGSGNSSAT